MAAQGQGWQWSRGADVAALVMLGALLWIAGGAVPVEASVIDWEQMPVDERYAVFQFDVYLQKGSLGNWSGGGSGSHIKGDFLYSIPLSGHPWTARLDCGGYFKYISDDWGGGITTKDDLELNIYYDENGHPFKMDIIRAAGYNTESVQQRFYFDFKAHDVVLVENWVKHYGEVVYLEVPEPATIVLLGLSLVGLLVRRKVQKRGMKAGEA